MEQDILGRSCEAMTCYPKFSIRKLGLQNVPGRAENVVGEFWETQTNATGDSLDVKNSGHEGEIG